MRKYPNQRLENKKPIDVILEEFKTLIQPVPKDKGNTFNRAEYQVSPVLTKRTQESNRVMFKFLITCVPHIRQVDRLYILERIKSLLCQTNLHYLASEGFQRSVTVMTRHVEADGSTAYVYLKDLADELRAHRENKSKENSHNSALPAAGPEADSQASSLGVTGRFNQRGAAPRPMCPASSSNTAAANKPPSAEASGLRGNPSGPQSPSSTAVQMPNSNALPESRISIGEQPGMSGLAGRVGNRRRSSRQVEREVEEQQLRNGIGRPGESSSLSRRDIRNIQKLQEYLLELCRSIRQLREEEVDFNEDDEDSAYIQEDRLTKRAWNVWRKLCKLEGRHPNTGCEQYKKFHFTGTIYPAINAEVERLVNNRIFPDFTDIRNLVKRANEQEDLGLDRKETETIAVKMMKAAWAEVTATCVRNCFCKAGFVNTVSDAEPDTSEAEEVFTSVGRELQRRRKRDELNSAMAYLDDYGDYGRDPAKNDPELRAKLEENTNVYQKRMDDVIQAYVNKQQELKLEPQEVGEEDCDRSPEQDSSNLSDDEENEKGSIEDDKKTPEKDLLENSIFNEGKQGVEEGGGEVCKPLCAAGSPASLTGEDSSKSPVAGGGSGLALTRGSYSASELSIKPIPERPLSSGPSGGSSRIAQLSISPVCGGSAAADLAIIPVPTTRMRKAELTITAVPVASESPRVTISPVPIASGKQGVEEGGGEVCKPLCAAGSPASLTGEDSSKSPVAGGGSGLALTRGSYSASELSIKPIPERPLSSGPSGGSSRIAQLSISPVCGGSAAADLAIIPVPTTRMRKAELTITAVPVASESPRVTISPVPIASGKSKLSMSLGAEDQQRHGTENGSILMPEVSIFPVHCDKLSPRPKDCSRGQNLPVKRRRSSPEKDPEGDIIIILSDDEVPAPPAKTFKRLE
ncbi:hypothetical protein V5799_014581 [Amblyomma americanum]|uniref:Daxx histone-binding domain-containing protein n=1 Tax=Amblyomma americanum TaxID=6943 RepID=A0AAQ4E2L4_AMBAM